MTSRRVSTWVGTLALAIGAAPALAAGWPFPRGTTSSGGTGSDVAVVNVVNPLQASRDHETVVVPKAEIARVVRSADFKALSVADATGKSVLSQLVDVDGDEEPDELVFQTDLAAGQTKAFKLRAGARTPPTRPEFMVYGRFVRERFDDFAWENDLVAHRVYGPALETAVKEPLVSSGIDVWVKRTHRLVVNDWYLTGDYHRDLGDGADFYGVGKSRGCGGLGLWVGGRLVPSKNFVASRVLANGPIRLVFELRYGPWDVGAGVRVSEVKRITLDAGTPWNQIESTFTASAPAKLSAGVGIARHPGGVVVVDPATASQRDWEPLKGAKGDANGSLGCAIVFAAGAPIEAHHDDLDDLVITPVPAGGKLVYQMGSAWDRATAIRDAAAWGREVQRQAARVAAPVRVTVSVPR